MNQMYQLLGSLSLLGIIAPAIPPAMANPIDTAPDVSSHAPSHAQPPVSTPASAFQSAGVLPAVNSRVPPVRDAAALTPAKASLDTGSAPLPNPMHLAQLDTRSPDSEDRVTAVDQLTDVDPSDWSYPALESLLSRYGCIQGYPDGTFRGKRAVTRAELVAALNACLTKVSTESAAQGDLDTTRALLEEVSVMLEALQGLLTNLEARAATLEAQQFSTTTKLQGQVVTSVQFGDFTNNFAFGPGVGTGTLAPFPSAPPPNDTGDEVIITPAAGPGEGVPALQNTQFAQPAGSAIARVRLSFNTSFSGSDVLTTVLETGNGGQDFLTAAGLAGPASAFPVPPGIVDAGNPPLVDLGAVDYVGVGDDVTLYRLAYSFRPAADINLTFGTNIYPSDFIDFNSYANSETQDFNSGFFINNPLIVTNSIDSRGGAGGAIDWNVDGGPFTLRGVYVAASPTVPILDEGGLFNNPFQLSAEAEYADTFGGLDQNNFAVRLQFTHFQERDFVAVQNVLGVNGEVTFGRVGLFGRYGISLNPQQELASGETTGLFALVPGVDPNTNIQTWMAGVGVKDLLVDGSLLAIGVGQPFLIDSSQVRYSPQTNLELFYRFPASENITLTPTLMLVTNPFNIQTLDDEPGNTILQILLRATFSF